jgi:hypothetical protein
MPDIVFTFGTMYKSVNLLRFKLTINSVDKCVGLGYTVVIVDGSPVPEIADTLREHGAIVYKQQTLGMGPARREAVFYALENCKKLGIKVIMFTEPEKDDFVRFAAETVMPILDGRADIVMSRRTEESRISYPLFQQEQELIMSAAYADAMNMPEIKTYLGPIAFSLETAGKYIILQNPKDYGIEDTYVQMYAPILARKDGVRIFASDEFDFRYPPEQRAEEEGILNNAMIEKRTWQTRSLMESFRKITKG